MGTIKYSKIGDSLPSGLSLGKGSTLQGSWIELPPGEAVASIGPRCDLRDCHISLGTGAQLTVGAGCLLRGRIIVGEACSLVIGDGLVCNSEARIQVAESGSIQIGNDCLFANPRIFNSDMHAIFDSESGRRVNLASDVRLGDRVWLATDTLVLKGTHLSEDTVVGAGAVVSGRHPGRTVLAGNPALVVRNGVRWSRHLIESAPLDLGPSFSPSRFRVAAAEMDHAQVLSMGSTHWASWPQMDRTTSHVFYYMARAVFELHFRAAPREAVDVGDRQITLSELGLIFEKTFETNGSNYISGSYGHLVARMLGDEARAQSLYRLIQPHWSGIETFAAKVRWLPAMTDTATEEPQFSARICA